MSNVHPGVMGQMMPAVLNGTLDPVPIATGASACDAASAGTVLKMPEAVEPQVYVQLRVTSIV